MGGLESYAASEPVTGAGSMKCTDWLSLRSPMNPKELEPLLLYTEWEKKNGVLFPKQGGMDVW